MKKGLVLLAVTLGFLGVMTGFGQAKDMMGSPGLGYQMGWFPPVGVSARLWGAPNLGLEGILGRACLKVTENDNDYTAAGYSLAGRLMMKVREEENCHFYLGAGMSYLDLSYEEEEEEESYWNNGDRRTRTDEEGLEGFGYELFAGAEWFFQGLPNIGFCTDFGWAGVSLAPDDAEDVDFNVTATVFGKAGFHYYF